MSEPGATPLSAGEFAERYRSSSRTLWGIAAGILGSPAEAEDVLQEACSMAFPKRSEFRADTSFAAWMGRFVRFVALNHLRKRQRRGTSVEAPEVVEEVHARNAASSARAPAEGRARLPVDDRGALHADQQDFDDRLVRALAGLAPMARSCLLLRAVLELEYREIAAVLEIPEGTAMSHVSRSRTALRVWLAGEPDARSRVGPVSSAPMSRASMSRAEERA
jgi:RNA polymerase sigma-70 factor (ECF subfamily)